MPRHVKLRHDAARDRWVILAPERVFTPDAIAVAVLKLCDGARSVETIAAELAQAYNAPSERSWPISSHVAGPRRQGRGDGVMLGEPLGGRSWPRARAPVGLLAELTHRCPLQCPYCSNPLALERVAGELPTEIWLDVLAQAAELGVLQLHLSGGEPTVRRDLEEIVAQAAKVGLYSNLITAGVLLTRERLEALADAGLDHVQISIQDAEAANADRIAHYRGRAREQAGSRRLGARARPAAHPQCAGASPEHRQPAAIIELAVSLGAQRLEVAHVQYYGWALSNRQALMPTREQVLRSAELVEQARERLKGILVIDFVVPDYYATRPKPCMGGWGRGIINITPSGKVLPCHAAETIPGLVFDNVREKRLRRHLARLDAFQNFRGTGWMREPCRSCELREVDWGGCRCQAFAFAGDAGEADPACAKSPHHQAFSSAAAVKSSEPAQDFRYRNPRAGGSSTG